MKKMNLPIYMYLLMGVNLIIFIFFITNYIKPKIQDYNNMKHRQEIRCKVQLRHSGGTSLYYPPTWDKEKDGDYFNYDIRSFDGGKNWYSVEIDQHCVDNHWGFKVLGDANELYPGLLEHIISWDSLTNYVAENGPINLSDTAGVNILKDAGFSIDTVK